MPKPQAINRELEIAIKYLLQQGEEVDYEKTKNLLRKKNLAINKSQFYKYLYNEHLYDWKNKSSNKKLQQILETERKISELEKTLSLVKATLESTADGILMINREGKLINWNKKFMEMFKLPASLLAEQNEQKGLQHFIDQVKDPQELFNLITKCYDDPNMTGDMGDMHFKDGRIFERYSQPHMVGDQIIGRVWSFRDVTEKRKKDQELRVREQAIEASTHGVLITENSFPYKIVYVNPAFTRITDKKFQQSIGESCFFWFKSDKGAAKEKLQLALKEEREEHISYLNYHADNSTYWTEIHIAPVKEHNKVIYFVWIINDITERKLMENRLIHQATHDSLTGLPNRSLLCDRLQQAIYQAKKYNKLIAILFLDLDRFKLVNDGMGHNIGDDLLKHIGKILLQCIREGDTVARLGGDEFMIICPIDQRSDAISLARRILRKISYTIRLENYNFNIHGSIGISLYPDNGVNIEILMRNADIAMYRAKELGRGTFQFFTKEMNIEVQRRLDLENNLNEGLLKHQFFLNYQPIFNLKTNLISGVEILLRWKHPEKGLISPVEFIPVAEDTGLIIPLSEWMMETACSKHLLFQKLVNTPLDLSINISPKQFQKSQLIEVIKKIMRKTKISPENLILELTERVLIEDSEKILGILNNLKKMKIRLSIDDFGTGYSSLSYLRQFPLSKLKIDKSFINGIGENQNDAAITQTIIEMSHILGLEVIAEGVETKKQMEYLQEHGCDEIQGFYFSKPLSEEELIELFKDLQNKSKAN